MAKLKSAASEGGHNRVLTVLVEASGRKACWHRAHERLSAIEWKIDTLRWGELCRRQKAKECAPELGKLHRLKDLHVRLLETPSVSECWEALDLITRCRKTFSEERAKSRSFVLDMRQKLSRGQQSPSPSQLDWIRDIVVRLLRRGRDLGEC